MTLDEAIKMCNKISLESLREIEELVGLSDHYNIKEWQTIRENHQQLAEWLTELKQWKENPFGVIDDYCSKIDDCVECDFVDCCPNRACKQQED